MTVRTLPTRRRLAWLVPLAVAGAVAGGTVVATAGPSDAAPVLPHRSAGQLLSKAISVAGQTTALSGTVHEVAALGLPDLPGQYGPTRLSWQTFVTGAHDLRVQVDGPARQRVALLGQLSEADVVHNGRNLWTYTSDTNTYTHSVLPARAARSERGATETGPASIAPPALAARFLKAVTPSTAVSVQSAQRVAGRPAYTLVLRPRDTRSTVREVTIALDAATFVPLQVQIFGAGPSPAVSVGFSDVTFARPPASAFAFRPPAGATLGKSSFTGSGADRRSAGGTDPSRAQPHVSVSGTAWTTVAELRPAAGAPGTHPGGPAALGGLLAELSGPIGTSGDRLVHTALINAVIRPDGTVFAGAVKPGVLEHAATR